MSYTLDAVTVRLGERDVLRDLTLALPARGTIAVFGPSGCGKTTLLRLLAGLLAPDSGAVRGMERCRVSMAFQEPRLLPWRSAVDNVALAAQTGHAQAQKLLQELGLAQEDFAKLPDALSGGMQQRVSLARAIAAPHDILLLDEPFAALDAANRAAAQELAYRASENCLTVLVTHDIQQAARADAVLLVDGPPLRVRERLELVDLTAGERLELLQTAVQAGTDAAI